MRESAVSKVSRFASNCLDLVLQFLNACACGLMSWLFHNPCLKLIRTSSWHRTWQGELVYQYHPLVTNVHSPVVRTIYSIVASARLQEIDLRWSYVRQMDKQSHTPASLIFPLLSWWVTCHDILPLLSWDSEKHRSFVLRRCYSWQFLPSWEWKTSVGVFSSMSHHLVTSTWW